MAEDNVIFDNKIHVPNPAPAVGDGPMPSLEARVTESRVSWPLNPCSASTD